MAITFKLNMRGLPLVGLESLAGQLQRQELVYKSSDLREAYSSSISPRDYSDP